MNKNGKVDNYDEIPLHLIKEKKWGKLYGFLLDINVFNYFFIKNKKELAKYWHKLLEIDKYCYVPDEYLSLVKKIGNKEEAVSFYNNLYSFYSDFLAKQRYKFALEIAMINLKLCEKVYGKESEITAAVLDKAADAYFKSYDYPNALGMYNKALGIRQKLTDKNGIALSNKNIKKCYEKLALFDENFRDSLTKTPEYFISKIKKDVEVFKLIPYELKTPQVCLAAVSIERKTTINFQNFFFALDYVPYELRTEEICKIAVTKEYSNYYYVPYQYKTEEINLIFMKKDRFGFLRIPEKARTKKLCEIALQDEPYLIKGVPEKYLTPDMCKNAVKRNANVLKEIPDGYKTYELCLAAVKSNADLLTYVPKKMMIDEIKLIADNNKEIMEKKSSPKNKNSLAEL